MRIIKLLSCVLLMLSCISVARAEEGMWTISNMTPALIQKMKDAGLKLSGEQMYSEKQNSLKDAVVIFDGGCTGEIVSANGLLFTNHHCGRDRVQQASTEKNNYIRDGYWAKSVKDEIPMKGLSVKFLIKTIDVTAQATELLKTKGIRKVMSEIETQYKDTVMGYTASLDGYSTGQYFVSVYQVFEDVRLVGIPPESIGNFGGETDNFEWPRQSADFSVFRIYANASNRPAPYSDQNKPFIPKNYLPVSLAGVHDNDFEMTIGFPGVTQRYITSYDLQEELDVKFRSTILAKGKYIEVVKREMDNSESVRLKYSSKNFEAGNSYKFAFGTSKYVKLSTAMSDKQKQEERFKIWVNANPERAKKYGTCLDVLEKNFNQQKGAKYAHALISAALFGDASLFGIRARNISELLGGKAQKEIEKAADMYGKWYNGFIRNYDKGTDQKIAAAMVKLVRAELKKEDQPDCFKLIDVNYNGSVDKYIEDIYAKSIFSSTDGVDKFVKSPDLGVKNDPLFVFGTSIYDKLIDLKKQTNDNGTEIRKANKLYQEGIREMEAGKLRYPDANFSMRLTYGKVCGANPRDGIVYKSQTTLKGVIEKEDSTNFEFYVWPRLKELYFKKDFGRYAEKGELFTCFLTSTDITGGNSGSPVINGRGELTGLAFDGNIESLAGSIIYEPEKNRSVNVDIRYVLFLIDKYAGSNHIMKELSIKQ